MAKRERIGVSEMKAKARAKEGKSCDEREREKNRGKVSKFKLWHQ